MTTKKPELRVFRRCKGGHPELRCSAHPKYRAVRKPTANCDVCTDIFRALTSNAKYQLVDCTPNTPVAWEWCEGGCGARVYLGSHFCSEC